LDCSASHDLYALTLERSLQDAGYIGVLIWNQTRQKLYDSDLGSVSSIYVTELATRCAAANNDNPFRDSSQRQCVAAGNHHLIVYGESRDSALSGSGGNDDVFRRESAAIVSDLDRVGIQEPTVALNVFDVVFLKQHRHAASQAADNISAAVDGLAEVVGQIVEADPEFVGVLYKTQHLGIPEQGLAGDAPPIQANAAKLVSLNDGGLET